MVVLTSYEGEQARLLMQRRKNAVDCNVPPPAEKIICNPPDRQGAQVCLYITEDGELFHATEADINKVAPFKVYLATYYKDGRELKQDPPEVPSDYFDYVPR